MICQHPLHGYRSARGLGRTFDKHIGILSRTDDTELQLCRLHRPTGIAEDAQHDLCDRFGSLVGAVGVACS